MNGKHLLHYNSCEDSKIFFSEPNSQREVLHKQYSSESRQKESASKASNFELLQLKKNPDLYTKLLNKALELEKTQKTVLTNEFFFEIQFETLFGERVVVTGEPEFLGCWDPLKGLELEWSDGGLWRANIVLGEGAVRDFDYKYVCIKKQEILWESGENRSVKTNEGLKQNSHMVFKRVDFWQT